MVLLVCFMFSEGYRLSDGISGFSFFLRFYGLLPYAPFPPLHPCLCFLLSPNSVWRVQIFWCQSGKTWSTSCYNCLLSNNSLDLHEDFTRRPWGIRGRFTLEKLLSCAWCNLSEVLQDGGEAALLLWQSKLCMNMYEYKHNTHRGGK